MQNLRPNLQRFFALLRRNPRQAAIAAVMLAAAGLILINPAPQRVAHPQQTQPAAGPAVGPADPAPARDIKTIDLALFPEAVGVRTSNIRHSKETNTPFLGDFWVSHVTDPNQPATLVWAHTLEQPATHLTISATVQLYRPRTTPRLRQVDNYKPKLEIVANGKIVRQLSPALWAGESITATLQLPQPADKIVARIVLPPRLQAGYVSITQLQMESW